MEPIINPWFFYYISVVDNIRLVTCVIGVVGLCFTAASAMLSLIDGDDDILLFPFAKRFKIVGLISIIFLLIFLFLPSKQTMAEMMIASHTTPDNINMAIEKIIECAVKITETL